MKRNILFRILYFVLIAVFLISVFNLGRIYYGYHKVDTVYHALQEEFISPQKPTPIPEEGETKETVSASGEIPFSVDFPALLEKNGDVIGWLYCPETVIHYPVVQGKTNDDYLRRDLDGKYLVGGTLFADSRNDDLGEDANFVIYGHNMDDGSMFQPLVKYKDQAYYDANPVMYYLTPFGNYRLELFAGLVVRRDDPIYKITKPSAEFQNLLKEYKEKSTFTSSVEWTEGDMIVTLSTCSYEYNNARYIVMGKLIPIHE